MHQSKHKLFDHYYLELQLPNKHFFLILIQIFLGNFLNHLITISCIFIKLFLNYKLFFLIFIIHVYN